MANEVRVPVRLDVLKDSVNDLQGILEHLKPDSSSFKHIVKYLQQMNDEMTRFQALTNSAFSDQAAFNKAGKSIDKMQESLNKANVVIGDLKFSDIKLDASQLKSFQAVEAQIKAIKEEFAGIKEQAKQSLLSDNATKDLIGNLNPSYLKKDFDALSKAVDSEVSKLETKLINAQNKLNDALNKKQAKADEINKLTTYGISKEGLGEDVFNRFFQQSKKGILSFNSRNFEKGEAKQEFLNYLAKQFTLTKSDLDSIQSMVKTGSAGQFDELFKNMGKSITGNVFTKRLDANTFGDLNGLRNAVAEAEKAQQELAAVQQKFNDIQGDSGAVGIAAEKYQASLDKLNEELLKLQNNAVNAAQALPQVAKGSSSATSELTQLQSALSQANSKFLQVQRTTQNFNQIKMAIVNFMGFRQTLNLVKSAISGALNHIKELDSVMNKISIVTDMSTADLWNQVDAYSKMAQTYGVSIKGAYEVSQIYYQQGLKTNDVLTLTNETLKLAKISGLDYAQTTDYMTTALRGFKLEMEDASTIVDVYSNLAAHTAVSSEELAIAMSKTASSMESIGSTFQETSAMIGTMVAVTRESSTNIGTALKSIASRYGEMKKDMSAVVDAEGEAISYNKVDAALQSIGISMKTADGQFREFTDVIIELGEKWGELDSIQQRYIATQFAGNRQQSRFLALVSNVDLLKQNIAVAEDSEDTGTLQALKALDSVESKLEQLKVSYQQFYTTVGGETIWKGMLDGARGFVDYLNGLPKLFGKIPVSAIAVIANALGLIKMLAGQAIGWIADTWSERLNKNAEKSGDEIGDSMSESMREQVNKMHDVGRELGKAASKGFQEGAAEGANQATSTLINAAVNKGGDVGAAVAQQQAQKQTPTTSSVDSQIATQDAMKSTVKDWFSGTFSDVDLDSGKDAIVANMTAAAANASSDLKPALSGVGADVSISIAQGILQSMGMTADAAKELSTTILNTIRSTLDIHSPSPTVIAMLKTGIGGATVQALAEAGADAGESAEAFGERLMQALADSIKNGEANIKNLMSALGDNFDELFKELSPHLTLTLRDDGLTEEQYKTFQERYEKNKAQFNETTRPINARGKQVESEIQQLEEEAEALRQEKIREAQAAHNSARAQHYESGMQDFNSLLPEEKYIQLQDLKNERAELLRQKHDAANLARSIRDQIQAEERATIQANSELISKQRELQSQAATQATENKIPTTIKDNIQPAVEQAVEIDNQIAKWERFLQLRQEIQAAGKKSSMRDQVAEWKTERDALVAELGVSKSMPTKDIQDIISGKVSLPAQQMSFDTTTGQLQETTAAANEAKTAIQELTAAEKEEAAVTPTSSDADSYKETAAAVEETAKHEANTEVIKQETEAVKELNAAKQEVAGGSGGNPPLTLDPSLDVIGHLESGRPVAPELGTSLNEIISLNTGDVLGKEEVVQLLNELQNVGVIAEDTKAKLLELYETRPTEEFIDAYSLATATNGSIADANAPIELASSNYRAVNQLEFNLDNLGPDNLLLAPVKLDTEEAIEQASTAREEIEGQLTFDDIKVEIKPEVKPEAVEEAIDQATPKKPLTVKEAQANLEAAKQAYANKQDYTYDSESDKYIPNQAENGMAYSPEEYTAKLQELKAAAEQAKVALDEALLADRPTQVANTQALIDKLVEVGAVTPEIGAQLTANMNSKSTEELIQYQKELQEQLRQTGNAGAEAGNKVDEGMKKANKNSGQMWSAIGMGITTLSSTLGGLVGQTTELGGAISSLGTIAGGAARIIGGIMSHSPMGWIMGITTAITGLISLIQNGSIEKRIERAEKKAEELQNKSKEAKANFKTLDNAQEKLDELEKKRYESAESAEEYQTAVDELAEKFPALVQGFDEAGNAILDTSRIEDTLTQAREESLAAALAAAEGERELAALRNEQAFSQLGGKIRGAKLDESKVAANKENDTAAISYWGGAGALLARAGLNLGWTVSEEDFTNEEFVNNLFSDITNKDYLDRAIGDNATVTAELAEQFRDAEGKLDNDAFIENLHETEAEAAALYDRIADLGTEYGIFDEEGIRTSTDLRAIFDMLNEKRIKNGELEDNDALIQEWLRATLNIQTLTDESAQANFSEGLKTFLAENTNLQSDTQVINALLEQLATAADNKDITTANEIYGYINEYVRSLSQYSDLRIYANEQLSGIFSEIAPLLTEANKSSSELEVANKYLVSSGLASRFSSTTSKSSGMMGLATSYYTSKVNDKNSPDAVLQANKDDIDTLDQFYQELGHKFTEDGENMQTKLDEMLADTSHYSYQDIIDVLGVSADSVIGKVLEAVVNQTGTILDSVKNNINEKLKESNLGENSALNTISAYVQQITTSTNDVVGRALTNVDRNYWNIVADRIAQLESNGNAGKAGELAQYVEGLDQALQSVDEATRNVILDSIKENGITTKEAISKIQSKAKTAGVEETDEVYVILEDLKTTTSTNILASMRALTDDLTSNWSDSSKSLKKLTSGIDFTEMQDILSEADTIGLDLKRSDFVSDGDKLVLTAEKASEYWEKFSEYNRGQAKTYSDKLDDASKMFTTNDEGAYEFAGDNFELIRQFQSNYQAISDVMGDELTNYLAKDEKGQIKYDRRGHTYLDLNKIDDLRARLAVKYSEDLDAVQEYLDYLDFADQQIQKSRDWDAGDYSSLMSDMGANYATRLAELARGAQYTTPELNAPDVKNAVDKIQSAYGSFISDLIEKGADKINLDTYKGIFKTDIKAIEGLLASRSTEEIIRTYAMNAGKTLEEVDGLLSQYVSKTTSKYTGIIEELMSYTGGEVTEVTREALGLDAYVQVVSGNATTVISKAKEFLQTLAEQIGKAGYKLSEYNATAKSILDKTLFNQGGNSKALLDFASGDIGADALETLANSFGLQLDQLVNVETGQVLGVIGNRLSYNAASGNYEIQGTFDGFIAALENQFGITIDRTSKQYVESLKAFNDAKITKEHEIDKAVTEELKGIVSLKPGESLNIAQTFTTLSNTMTGLFEMSDFKAALKEMGANFVDGILTIEQGADIQGIIQAIAQKAAEAGALLPEELDELNDALVQVLRDITNIISSGIGGSISSEQKRTLTKWAADYGVTDLQFIETAEGYQLATESAKELYHTINAINSLQGQVVFEKLKDNLIETDERFKSINSTTGYIRELETKGLSTSDLETLSKLNGNVDMFNRPVLQNEDGTISTIIAATEESRNYESDLNWVMNITPITPAGEKLEDEDLYKYIQNLVDKSGGKMDEMIKLDKAQLGLIIEGENVELKNQEEIVKQYDLRAEKLHLIGEAIEKNKQVSAEELALAQKMNEVRGLTEDDSFKFMDQDIPSGQKNPLNYFESWNKAYQAMKATTTGGKSQKGKMAYQDFYNLITEMGNLEKITGKSIQIGKNVKVNSENVASLIEQAAGALEVQSDGSLKVNLSKIGVDFAAGADAMNTNVAGGIKEVAASQVQMLDQLIGLLETIVTMEDAFKQFNVDADMDMELDFDEIFKVKKGDDGSIQEVLGFADNWQNALDYLRKKLDPKDKENYSEDFARGAESIQFAINGFQMSLAQLLNTDFAKLSEYGFTEENFNVYQAIMEGVYDAIQSGDYTELNIKELIMEKLSKSLGEGGQVTFDMGNYTFIGTKNGAVEINWDQASVKKAVDRYTKEVVQAAITASKEGTAKGDQLEIALEAQGFVKVDGKKSSVEIDGKTYTKGESSQWTEALGAKLLESMGAKDIYLGESSGLIAQGTMTFGETEVTVGTTESGAIKYITADGSASFDSLHDLIAHNVDQALASEEYAGLSAEELENKRIELTYQAEVRAGISSFELNSQSYANLDANIRKELEDALASGDRSKIDIAINAHSELKSLTGLTSSEIEEKLGIKEIPIKVNGNVEEANTKLEELQKKVKDITDPPYTIDINLSPNVVATYATLSSINQQLESIANNKTQTINITKNITTNESTNSGTTSSNKPQSRMTGAQEATGNFAMAQGTLMGELGQELVVSNGRYFVVGQNGPEFVDLADDAIVFNHLQTEQLLKHGMSNTRGKAVTSEQNAVAFAKGNLAGGPALASARAVLAQLKQLRAMWKSLGNTSAQDLAGLGGSGGGGGGGDKDDPARKAWIEAVERWYDLMQEIAKLEKEITHQEALRTKLSSDWQKNGAAYYQSQKKTLQDIEKQMIAQEELNISKRDYFNQRMNQLNKYGAFKDWYQFDEQGQLKYNDGALAFLSDLTARDANNVPKYSLEEQYNMLIAQGYGAQMQYTSSGEEIQRPEAKEGETPDYSDFYATSIQAVWDQVEAEKQEMQSLYDTIAEGEDKMLELANQRNEILTEIRDNQIEVEKSVLNAIVQQRQDAIDKLSEERKALEESTSKYIEGLSNALNKEKEMYDTQQSEEELNKKRRQLAILERSSAPASQINSLKDEIAAAEQDQYFNLQQQAIDKIQEASDLEIERLDTQIDLMTTTLEYEKEHGLLWGQVYDYLFNHSAEEIAFFSNQYNEGMWGASPLETEKQYQEELFKAQQWAEFQRDSEDTYQKYIENAEKEGQTIADAVYGNDKQYSWNVFNTAMTKLYGDQWKNIAGTMKNKFFENFSKTGDITAATNSLTSSLSSLGSQLANSVGGAFSSLKSQLAEAKAQNSGGGGSGNGSNDSGSKTNPGKTPATTPSNNNSNSSHGYTVFVTLKGSDGKTYSGSANNAVYDTAYDWAYRAASEKIPYGITIINKSASYERYLKGGLADYTGPAWVDGTKSKPEAVLNAHQTKILRDDILSNKPTSLMNLLLDFKDAYEGIGSNYSTTNNDSGIIIENATVEMRIDQISNDYDARRAGEQALSEMMRIARKTSAKNSVRR